MFPELTGYLFPNDIHIGWSVMIVLYPFVTGIVAGAFVVASLYHVFGRSELKPVARLAMATSLCFLAVAPLPLLFHLGHPERALNVLITPNFASAMSGFGFLYAGYLVILLVELWLVFRPDIIAAAVRTRGLRRFFFKVLALGVYDLSPEALAVDGRAIRFLAALGIPAACLLHGYVGFLFGALKSNAWWSTPLMPVIFLFSAMVSGVAMLVVLYQVAMKIRGEPIDRDAVSSLARWLWLFMIMSLTLELLEIVTLAYERAEEWEVIGPLLANQLSVSFISVQMVIGGLIPLILLGLVVIMGSVMHDRIRNTLTVISSLLLLLQVASMRWNVVMGGQLFSKSMRGFREGYVPEFFGREGVLMAILLGLLPLVLLFLFSRVLPILRGRAAPVVDGIGPTA